ncbi:hypothetical protein M5D96_007406 [Drosophila gunungcola]|uniref:Uncharacterized protein n=1 Tax=Drosophila gunungcola TaxID=103775 RepID=A0A9Q0BQ10_9MUSC|nr:hypothetical protein M5D96_007406 [Drosophila gunungcola]
MQIAVPKEPNQLHPQMQKESGVYLFAIVQPAKEAATAASAPKVEVEVEEVCVRLILSVG